MKLFILAAGKGTRLMPLTTNTPKALIDLGNGTTLLESQLESAYQSGVIDEVVIVTGYLAEQIDAKLLSRLNNGDRIRTFYNPFFETTNNFVSLWLLRHAMGEDFMITNGDNLIASEVFKQFALENPGDGVYLCSVEAEACGADDMKIVHENGVLERVSKDVPLDQASGESPGLALVRGQAFRRLVSDQIDEMSRHKKYLDGYWLELFNCLAASGMNVRIWEFSADLWREVDIHLDVEQARKLLINKVSGYVDSSEPTSSADPLVYRRN